MKVHPYLIARAYSLLGAFAHPGYVPSVPRTSAPPAAPQPFDWDALLKKEDGEGDASGGGGTAKGLRQKNHESGLAAAKAEMRRLGRK